MFLSSGGGGSGRGGALGGMGGLRAASGVTVMRSPMSSRQGSAAAGTVLLSNSRPDSGKTKEQGPGPTAVSPLKTSQKNGLLSHQSSDSQLNLLSGNKTQQTYYPCSLPPIHTCILHACVLSPTPLFHTSTIS